MLWGMQFVDTKTYRIHTPVGLCVCVYGLAFYMVLLCFPLLRATYGTGMDSLYILSIPKMGSSSHPKSSTSLAMYHAVPGCPQPHHMWPCHIPVPVLLCSLRAAEVLGQQPHVVAVASGTMNYLGSLTELSHLEDLLDLVTDGTMGVSLWFIGFIGSYSGSYLLLDLNRWIYNKFMDSLDLQVKLNSLR